MKKATMEAIYNYLNGKTVTNLDEIKGELEAELNKGKAKAEATKAEYTELHDKVMGALKSVTDGATAQEIADEINATKGKVVYGLVHYWADEVEKDTSGKSTVYRLA